MLVGCPKWSLVEVGTGKNRRRHYWFTAILGFLVMLAPAAIVHAQFDAAQFVGNEFALPNGFAAEAELIPTPAISSADSQALQLPPPPSLNGLLESEISVQPLDTEGVTSEVLYSYPMTAPGDWLQLDTSLTYALLDFQNRQTDKEVFILLQNFRERWQGPQVIAGGQARLSAIVAHTNRTNKFSYLGRFPTDFTGDWASDARILQANAQLTAAVTPWASVYGELLFSDVFTFSSFNQGSLQMRQAYAVLGDFNVSPWYGFIGKKNVGFGDMSTLSPFTQSVVWHYFAALAEGVGVGYYDHGLHATLAGINGGRGIRVADSVSRGKINNFAANLSYTLGNTDRGMLTLGLGYLHGTIFDGLTAEHLDQNQFGENYNGAWDVNARFDLGNLTVAGEYVSTVADWPVTNNHVSAYRLESAYALETVKPSRLSISWSDGRQGPAGSQFEFNRQLVLGYGVYFNRHALGTIEYVRSTGFAPLIDITTVSDRNVAQDSIVLGLNLVL